MQAPWLLLQLADGAFPSGGFAHSMGLEASLAFGGVADAEAFLDQLLGQVGRSALPFVRAACEEKGRLAALDAACEACLPGHVANRASRAQGRALALAMARVFDGPETRAIAEYAREGPAHHAPVFGASFAALGVSARDAQIAFLHGAARAALSAAVRLGAIGPLEAQRLHASRGPMLEEVLTRCGDLTIDRVAQTAPLVELFGALHDRLDGRLFQS